MKFPQEFIERVRESTNIVDLVGQYVQLKRSGGNYQGLCPFHNEKSPSFSVSEDKQVYHCFGCKASGNVYSFVQNYQGLTFPEAVEYLANRAGLALPEPEAGVSRARDEKQILFKINAWAAQFYHDQLLALPETHVVKSYLRARGLSQQTIDQHKVGYAPEAWSDLAQLFASKKVPVATAEKLGLIKPRTGGKSGHYDLFRHRLMFPIFSPTGQCLGFGGRVLSKDQAPKYLNSPDSYIFHKGKVFYGLNHSAKFIRSADEVIVVEGYMDWLALVQAGVDNVVATLGTALTHDHARAVRRYTNKVLLLFDGDEAGKGAAARSLPILLSEGLHARGLFLPDQLDPDEFLRARGVTELRDKIAHAPDLFDLVTTEAWLAAKGKATSKVQLMDEFGPTLALTTDERMRSLYSDNLANLLDVDRRLVEQSVKRAQSAPHRPPSKPSVPPVETAGKPLPEPELRPQFELNKVPRAELEILNLILLKEVYLKEALSAQVGEQFRHPGAKGVWQRIVQVYGQMPNKFDNLSALLAGEVKPVEMITRHLTEPFTSLSDESAKKLLEDCIKRVKDDFYRSQTKDLVSSLRGSGPTNPTEQLEQIMNIHKSRRSLNRDS